MTSLRYIADSRVCGQNEACSEFQSPASHLYKSSQASKIWDWLVAGPALGDKAGEFGSITAHGNML
jgi:hypothetical protein